MIELVLPYPPSVNNYYKRSKGGGVYCSPTVGKFRNAVKLAMLQKRYRQIKGQVVMHVKCYMPTRRLKQDIDNCLKGLCDALTIAEAYEDDMMIFKLHMEKVLFDDHLIKGGKVEVIIEGI